MYIYIYYIYIYGITFTYFVGAKHDPVLQIDIPPKTPSAPVVVFKPLRPNRQGPGKFSKAGPTLWESNMDDYKISDLPMFLPV